MNINVTIPGYTIERKLDQGGMATVYLGHSASDDEKVAIKVMAPYLAADPSFCERFLQECYLTRQLVHPNILTISAYGEANSVYYMVMEYLPGGTLTNRISDKSLTIDDSLLILTQIAKALGHAHSKQVIHRDVKPSNVMFRSENDAVLTDFGISKAIVSSNKLTMDSKAIGSPTYMSPEQIIAKDVDTRSDIYSLGIMFYEMLTGKVPFDAENAVAIAIMHQKDPIPLLPDELSQYQPLLDGMLAKSADDRFQTTSDLLNKIDDIQTPVDMKRTVMRDLLPEIEKEIESKEGNSTNNKATSRAKESNKEQNTVDQKPASTPTVKPDNISETETITRKPWLAIVGTVVILAIVAGVVKFQFETTPDSPAIVDVTEPDPEPLSKQAPEPLSVQAPESLSIQAPEKTPIDEPTTTPLQEPVITQVTPITETESRNIKIGSTKDEITAALELCKRYSQNCNKSAYDDESLQTVSLKPYIMDKSEVTITRFQQFVDDTSYTTTAEKNNFAFVYQTVFDTLVKVQKVNWRNPEGPGSNNITRMNHPVTFVTLDDAQLYCRWAGGRLPTEAEWEYAARGETRNIFPWGNSWDESKAHWQTGDINGTTDVRSLPAGNTEKDLYGLSGNVWEWTSSADKDKRSILKGGSWAERNPANLRASARRVEDPSLASSEIGFRCVQDSETWALGEKL